MLTCMRSGDYHFAAVVRHRGKRTDGGHYLTTCWIGGDRYSEINCLPVGHQREVDWQSASRGAVRREAYLLFYERVSFRDGVGDGREATPYARDLVSLDITSQSFPVEPCSHQEGLAGTSSASGRSETNSSSRASRASFACGSSQVSVLAPVVSAAVPSRAIACASSSTDEKSHVTATATELEGSVVDQNAAREVSTPTAMPLFKRKRQGVSEAQSYSAPCAELVRTVRMDHHDVYERKFQ